VGNSPQTLSPSQASLRTYKPVAVQAQVIAKRASGLSERKISQDLGLARATIRKILKASQIDANLTAEALKAAEASARSAAWQPETVKTVIRERLLSDITKGKSSGVAREAELLGRDKTVDMWVRPADVQIGIFNALQGDSAAILDQLEPGELIQSSTTPALPSDTPDQP